MKNCSFFLFVCLYYYFSCSRKASYFGSNISEVGDHYKRMSFPFSADFAKQEEQGAGKVFLLTKRRGNVLRHFLLSFYWRDAPPPPPPPPTCTSLPRTLQFSFVLHFYRWVIKLREEKRRLNNVCAFWRRWRPLPACHSNTAHGHFIALYGRPQRLEAICYKTIIDITLSRQ